ncbi:hypothetical protein GS481_01865 [Rhodococcus hoagii]|nr:hypothetical protein [Prescottella equi]
MTTTLRARQDKNPPAPLELESRKPLPRQAKQAAAMLLAAGSLAMLAACGSEASGTEGVNMPSKTPNPAGEWAQSVRGLAQEIVNHGINCTTFKPGSSEDWGTCGFYTSEGKFNTYTIGVFGSTSQVESLKTASGFRKDGVWGPNWVVVCEPPALCKSIQAQMGGIFP